MNSARNETGTALVPYRASPEDANSFRWITRRHPDVPWQFTESAQMLYHHWQLQQLYAEQRLNALGREMETSHAHRTARVKAEEKLLWWRIMGCAMGAMLIAVWANTYIFGG